MNTQSLSQFHMSVLNALGGIEYRLNGVKKYLKERTLPEPVNLDWSPDIAKQERDLHCEIEIGAHAERRRQALLNTLRRIEDGTYGICLGCENEIDARRLDAEPCAERCMDCMSIESLPKHQGKPGISRAFERESIDDERADYAIHPKTLALITSFKEWNCRRKTNETQAPDALSDATHSPREMRDRIAIQRENCGAGGLR